jgi:RNA-directed DNA polymerase
LFTTDKGTQQGGIISPTIANMTLDGIVAAIDKAFGVTIRSDGCRKNNPNKIRLISYADYFIVTATDKETLEKKVKPIIENFLELRGLQLSQEKSKITHITEGCDFLRQNSSLVLPIHSTQPGRSIS